MPMSLEELKRRFQGMVFDSVQVEARAEDMVGFAKACGETDPRYTDPAHPDFRAPVNFTTKYHGARMLPDDFPEFERNRMIDAGKAVNWHAPIRAGDTLTARSQLYDIYDRYASLEALPTEVRRRIEGQIFLRPLDEVWACSEIGGYVGSDFHTINPYPGIVLDHHSARRGRRRISSHFSPSFRGRAAVNL